MKIEPRHCLCAALLLGCLFVATGKAQYVEDSIDVGGAWVGSLAYNPAARVIYGASQSSYYFFAISCDSHKVISSIYRQMPMYIAYDSIDGKAYFTQRTQDIDSVIVVDGVTHRYLKGIPLLWATVPVWDAVSDRLYVSCADENEVGVIDCATDSVIGRIRVGQGPIRMDMNSQGRKLYVRNGMGESVSIIDMQTNQLIRTIPLGNVPTAGCFCLSTGKYYCGADGIYVIDGAGDTVVAHIPLHVGTAVLAMAAVEAHSLVMACGYTGQGDSVFVIDALSDTVVRALPASRQPRALLWSSTTDLVYCARGSCDSVSVIRGDGSRVAEVIPVGLGPFALTLAPELGRVYLGHLGSDFVYVLRDTVTGVAEPAAAAISLSSLIVASPNPFTRTVAIRCGVRLAPGAGIYVFSQDGRQVRRLAPNLTLPGSPTTSAWDGKDEYGRCVPRGVYLAVVEGQAGVRAKLVKLD
jgi:YVTN family beta-propeller protein